MTANPLADRRDPVVVVHPVSAPPNVEQAFAEATDAIINARRIKAPLPFGVARATRLVTTMTRCISDVTTYNQMAVVDHPRASNMFSLDRQLQRDDGRFGGPWHAFEQGRWAGLRGGAVEAYKSISLVSNPKVHALIDLLDQICRRQIVPRVVVRASNRTAAMATIDTLGRHASEILDRLDIVVLSWSQRVPWDDENLIEILPSAPPVALHPILWSAESAEHIILAYKHELPLKEPVESRVTAMNEEFQRPLALSVSVKLPVGIQSSHFQLSTQKLVRAQYR